MRNYYYKSWKEFYQNKLYEIGINHYYDLINKKYKTFLDTLRTYIEDSDTVIEAGCGLGNSSRYISEFFYDLNIICIDDSLDMLNMCCNHLTNNRYILNLNMLNYRLADIRSKFGYSKSDVIYSNGVLEHFDPDDVRLIIRTQLEYSRVLIHCVPTNEYKTKSFGDERLLSMKEWGELFGKELSPTIFHQFNENHELIMIWNGK